MLPPLYIQQPKLYQNGSLMGFTLNPSETPEEPLCYDLDHSMCTAMCSRYDAGSGRGEEAYPIEQTRSKVGRLAPTIHLEESRLSVYGGASLASRCFLLPILFSMLLGVRLQYHPSTVFAPSSFDKPTLHALSLLLVPCPHRGWVARWEDGMTSRTNRHFEDEP